MFGGTTDTMKTEMTMFADLCKLSLCEYCHVARPSRTIYVFIRYLTPGGAGAPTQESLCLHISVHTTWGLKTDHKSAYFDC